MAEGGKKHKPRFLLACLGTSGQCRVSRFRVCSNGFAFRARVCGSWWHSQVSTHTAWLSATPGHLSRGVKCGVRGGGPRNEENLVLVGTQRDLGFQILRSLNYIHRSS